MKYNDDEKRKNRTKATGEKLRAPREDHDGVIRNSDDCGDEDDHEITEDPEARAKLEQVDIHSWNSVSSIESELREDCN